MGQGAPVRAEVTRIMTTEKRKFGAILVANGTISEKTLLRALEKAHREKTRIGETLENMGVATAEETAATLAEQFRCKIVKNFAGYSYSPELLKYIPADTATRYFLFPLKLDKKNLYLAMADPTDTRIVANIASNHNLTIIPFIASRSDIVAAVNKHYLGKQGSADKRPVVLVVEDNQVTSTGLDKVLSGEGYRVVVAKDGIQAFKLAISEAPEVIVTDKEMPIFGGYQLLESLKSLRETAGIPVILMTGSLNASEESEAFRKGFFDYLAKPVKDVTLLSRVKRAQQHFAGMR
jgi:CheY-like chemotaxis protein